MVNNLFQSLLFFFVVLLLIIIEFIKVLYMILFFLQPNFVFFFSFVQLWLQIFNSIVKRFDLFFEPAILAGEHLPHRSFFLDELLNLIIFVGKDSFKLDHFSLKTLNISLVIDL